MIVGHSNDARNKMYHSEFFYQSCYAMLYRNFDRPSIMLSLLFHSSTPFYTALSPIRLTHSISFHHFSPSIIPSISISISLT